MLRKEKEIKRIKLSPQKRGNRGLTIRFMLSMLPLKRLPYIFGFCLIIVFLLNPFFGVSHRDYHIGELVDRDIKAPFTMSVVDKESTEKERLTAENSVLPVYDYDNYDEKTFVDSSYYKRISEAFSLMRMKYKRAGASGTIKVELSPYEVNLLKKDFNSKLGVEIPERTFKFLATRGFNPRIERIILLILKNVLKTKIISRKDLDNVDQDRGIILNFLRGKNEHQVSFKNFNTVITNEKALETVKKSIKEIFPRYRKTSRKAIFGFFEKIISPTLTFNREKTEAMIAKARESQKPVVVNIKKGEMIIRDGTFINKRELMILKAINEKSVKTYSVTYLIGAFILIFLFYVTICSFSSRFIKKFSSGDKDLFVMGLSIVILILFFKWYSNIIPAISGDTGSLAISVWHYLFPFAVGAMVVRLLFNSETAVIYAFVISLLFGIFLEKNLFFTIFVFFSSIIAAGMVGYAQDRAVLLKAGLKTGLYNIVLVLVLSLIGTASGPLAISYVFYSCLTAFLGGLIRLANLNQPLLRELMVHCPGTYHHSMIVGNLVEAAAESIKANSLLSRVAAYYHDIGKLRKPEYFIENKRDKENKHDKLTPSMSALILISHIKDGVELAEEYNLGYGIRDIIQQHQGTTLIKFFYNKAIEKASEDGKVEEKDFRYPGPKPQTKEAALVMIADQVEATVRALTDPGHTRIKGSVQKTIDYLFEDGQFDNCDLTLRDLNTISDSFVRVLTGMQHQRIDYPTAAKGVEKGESTDKSKEEVSGDKSRQNRVSSANSHKSPAG